MQHISGLVFELDQLIADCHAALADGAPQKAMREVVARAVSEPAAVLHVLGEPRRAQIQKLYHSPEITILNITWAPHMAFMPHNHRMWAIIGIYGGCEDNVFWRRVVDESGERIERVGAKTLLERDAEPLGRDIIHSVRNPTSQFTGAIHVYGGDFFGVSRSEWDPGTLLEQPYSVEKALRLFDEANARCAAS
jgi:predicted metal-dependent enzyme (double-stranded beta helix superfamily)